MLVRYVSPSGPMCMMHLMLTLSGPVELFLLCFIASWTCVVVVCSVCVFLSMCLFGLCVSCIVVVVDPPLLRVAVEGSDNPIS